MMKGLTVSELDNVVKASTPLIGARLQEFRMKEPDLALGFYSQSQVLWLWLDLSQQRPLLLPWENLPRTLPSQTTPLILFLRAHFDGRRLLQIERVQEQGRVIRLHFVPVATDSSLVIEIRLFPHGANVIAQAGEKQVSWWKRKDIAEHKEMAFRQALLPDRSLTDLRAEWLAERGGSPRKKDPRVLLAQEVQRKEKALSKVQAEVARQRSLPWREIGFWLKENQSLAVPDAWSPFVDKRRKLAWNIEECFKRARESDGKIFGAEQRVVNLQTELARLHQEENKPEGEIQVKGAAKKPSPMLAQQASGRTLRLPNDLVATSGKSAADNLKLLRTARAWDYWLHLQDYPSTHVILFRNKGQKVSEEILRQVVVWYLHMHFGQKYKQHVGDKVSVIVAECRHVRPIKGDKLGRVTFHDERILMLQVPP